MQDEAIGSPATMWLDQVPNLRTTSEEDPWHRIVNDMRDALVGGGAWLPIVEHTIVYNGRAGPCTSNSFAGQVKGAYEE